MIKKAVLSVSQFYRGPSSLASILGSISMANIYKLVPNYFKSQLYCQVHFFFLNH